VAVTEPLVADAVPLADNRVKERWTTGDGVEPAMAELTALTYRAFISYSHADTSWAKWLQRGLESFRIDKDLAGRETATGTVPKTLRPVFRDRDDFTAGHSLTDQTLAALDASAALIIICSPAAAKSAYVTEEVRPFKARHPDRPIIPLIVGGKPGDPELECFPASLKFRLDDDGKITDEPVEMLAADAREQGDGKHLALAKVVAGLLGVSSDDIFRRAERDRRRKQRSWIAGLSAVAISWPDSRCGPRSTAARRWRSAKWPSATSPSPSKAPIRSSSTSPRRSAFKKACARRRYARFSARPKRSSTSSSPSRTTTWS